MRLGIKTINKSGSVMDKFETIKAKILAYLDSLERKEEPAKKAVKLGMKLEKAVYPVGTVRVWKGKRYRKIAPGKWRPTYDSHSRGAKMAIAHLKRKIANMDNPEDIMKLMLEHRDRFSDVMGRPMPFVQELSDYIKSKEYQEIKAEEKTEKPGKVISTKNVKYVSKTGNNIEIQVSATRGWEIENRKKITIYKNNIRIFINGIDYGEASDATHIYKKKPGVPQEVKNADIILLSEYKNAVIPIPLNITEKLKNAQKEVKNIAESSKEWRYIKEIENKHRMEDKKYIEQNKRLNEIMEVGFSKIKQEEPKKQREPEVTGEQAKQEKIEKDWADWNKVYNKYKAARKEEGEDAEIYVNGKAIQGVWQLVEADTPTASHDENTFNMTPGFPINSDGTTMNDRDYQHDRFAQESVLKFGSDYDGRALSFDNPVVVSQEGIVISGNNRTMSSKRAARAGTDKKYIEALRKRAHIYGFGPDLVDDFEHPRVIFQTHVERYTTDEFAKYNKGTKKEMGPTEKAVKVSKLIKQDTVDSVARQIGEHETMGELYQDRKATAQIIEEFTRANLIGENELGRYLENGVLTEDGKQFIETALLGTVINEGNLRRFNQPGARSIRATLVRGLAPLVENKSLSGYSINKELNEAVDIIIQVATDRETFKTVQDFADQKDMFEEYDPIAMELAKKLEGTQKQFAEFMQSINGGLKVASAGEADIFLGGVESRDDVIARYINVKKSVIEAIRDFGASRLIKSLRGFYR